MKIKNDANYCLGTKITPCICIFESLVGKQSLTAGYCRIHLIVVPTTSEKWSTWGEVCSDIQWVEVKAKKKKGNPWRNRTAVVCIWNDSPWNLLTGKVTWNTKWILNHVHARVLKQCISTSITCLRVILRLQETGSSLALKYNKTTMVQTFFFFG